MTGMIKKDKSFCLGPATFSKLVHDLELTGSVIQTHVNSPRTTAYLATLLYHNEKIKKLMAFSAGESDLVYERFLSYYSPTHPSWDILWRDVVNFLECTGLLLETYFFGLNDSRNIPSSDFVYFEYRRHLRNRKNEYEAYFNQLGMSNIVIFSNRLIDAPPDANYMEDVVAILATPPNSYSAVVDPIDLVCSRGGDLSMLEILTESSDTKEARDRVASILEEQKKTLRFAMSRPQLLTVEHEACQDDASEEKPHEETEQRRLENQSSMTAGADRHAATRKQEPTDQRRNRGEEH